MMSGFVRLCRIRILCVFILCVVTSASSFAQDEQYYSECRSCAEHLGGNGVIGPLSKQACQDAVAEERRLGFPFSECHTGAPSSTSHQGWVSPQAAVYGSTVVFGAAGGLAGSFWDNPQGQTFGYGGAALGAGTFGFTALVLNARKLSRPTVVVTSALDFGLAGAGAAQAVQYNQEWANPKASAPDNKSIVIGGAVGVAVGTVVGWGLPHSAGSATSAKTHPFVRAVGHMRFAVMPQRMSMRFSW